MSNEVSSKAEIEPHLTGQAMKSLEPDRRSSMAARGRHEERRVFCGKMTADHALMLEGSCRNSLIHEAEPKADVLTGLDVP